MSDHLVVLREEMHFFSLTYKSFHTDIVIWERFSSQFMHFLFFIHTLLLFFLFPFCKRKETFKYKKIWKMLIFFKTNPHSFSILVVESSCHLRLRVELNKFLISWCKVKPVQCNDIKMSPRIIDKIYSSKKYMLCHWYIIPYITALDRSRWEAELTIVYLVEYPPCYRLFFPFDAI